MDLIARVLDNAPSSKYFQVSIDESLAVNGKDVFKLSNGATPGTISISASTGVAAAMGFNYYLKYVAHSSGKMKNLVFFCFVLLLNINFSLLVGKEYCQYLFEIDSIKRIN